MLSTLFFPLIPWLLQLILFAWFVVILVFLATSGEKEFKKVNNGTVTQTICSATVSSNYPMGGYILINITIATTQLAFTCSKSTMDTLEHFVKSVHS